MGNACIWTEISSKKVIAHGLHLQLHVELQPYDLITMSMRLEQTYQRKTQISWTTHAIKTKISSDSA